MWYYHPRSEVYVNMLFLTHFSKDPSGGSIFILYSTSGISNQCSGALFGNRLSSELSFILEHRSSSPIEKPICRGLKRSSSTQTQAYLALFRLSVWLSILSKHPKWLMMVLRTSPSHNPIARWLSCNQIVVVKRQACIGWKNACQGESWRTNPLTIQGALKYRYFALQFESYNVWENIHLTDLRQLPHPTPSIYL